MATERIGPRLVKRYKEMLRVSHAKFKSKEETDLELFRRYYKGLQWPSMEKGTIDSYREKTVDNVIFSNIKTIMPSINFRNAKIFVQAKKKPYRTPNGIFDTISSSVILEVILNYYYKELELKRQVDKCLFDALVGHRGIMLTGYTIETEKIKGDELLEVNELIKGDSPFAIRIKPEDFRIDPEAGDSHLEDARWIAFREVKTLDELKKNDKYINTRDLKTNFTVETDFIGKSDALKYEDSMGNPKIWNRVEFWNIWDKKEQKIISIVDNHEAAIRYEDWPLEYGGGFPAEILYFNENPDDSLPLGDLEIYIDSQDELNKIGSMQLDHIRRISQRRYATREGRLDENAKRQLQYGGDGTIIETDDGGPIEPIQDATISQDIYVTRQMLKNNIREESGVAQFEKGGAQKFEQATEPALIQQSIQNKRGERVEILENFISRVMRKIALTLQQTLRKRDFNLTEEQFAQVQESAPSIIHKIVGQRADILLPWATASKADIQGEYDFTVEVGSTKPVDKLARRSDAMGLYQLFGGHPLVNQPELIKRVLEAFETSEIEKLLKDPQQAAQEQQQSMEAAIQAEVAKDAPKRDVDLKKTQLKVAQQREAVQTNANVSLLTAALQADGKKKAGGEK